MQGRPILQALALVAVALPALAAEPELKPPELLHFEPPVWPTTLGNVLTVVELELQVDPTGHVVAQSVVQSAGAAADRAAMTAARLLAFAPARQGDQPVGVRLRFRYTFDPDTARRPAAASLGAYPRRDVERTPSGFSSLRGRVVERGTGKPIAGALLLLQGPAAAGEIELLSDGEGHFASGPLPPGAWKLQLPAGEHAAQTRQVSVRAGATAEILLRLERATDLYHASVEAPQQPGEMTRRSLSADEIQKVPGVYGDALKVVQNLPGVSRPTPLSGEIVVRGAAPSESLLAIEGIRVPVIYHFGGLYSVVNTDLLEAVDFLPGGYPVAWGRQLGGVLNARLKAPPDAPRWHGYGEVNAFHVGLLLEMPLGPDTSLSLAGRRSHIDALLALVLPAAFPTMQSPFTLAPRYYDGQVKLDHRFGRHTSLTVLGFGSDDALALVSKDPIDGVDPNTAGKISTVTRFAAGIAVLRHDGGQWTSKTTLGGVWAESDTAIAKFVRFNLQGLQLSLRQDFTFGTGPVQARTGLDIEHQAMWFDAYAPLGRAAEEGPGAGDAAANPVSIYVRDSLPAFSPAAWFDMVWRPDARWEVVPGMRLDGYLGNGADATLLPRLNVRRALSDTWVLKAATGLSSQRAQVFQVVNTFGNPALTSHRGWEIAAGVEWQPSAVDLIDVQLFHKRFWNLTILAPGLFPVVPYLNGGTGEVFGMEWMLRHKVSGRWFGWLAYTLQRAMRQDGPGQPNRLFDWDQTHILTAVANYKLGGGWELGGRFRLVSGNPYTPVGTAVWSEHNDAWTPVPSTCVNCSRLPAFQQLDLRLDKRFTFDSWLLHIYLDVQNVYNYRSPEDVSYNYDYSKSQWFTGLPIIPSLGVKGEY